MTKQQTIEQLRDENRQIKAELESYKLAYGLLADQLTEIRCAKKDGHESYFNKLVAELETVTNKAQSYFV